MLAEDVRQMDGTCRENSECAVGAQKFGMLMLKQRITTRWRVSIGVAPMSSASLRWADALGRRVIGGGRNHERCLTIHLGPHVMCACECSSFRAVVFGTGANLSACCSEHRIMSFGNALIYRAHSSHFPDHAHHANHFDIQVLIANNGLCFADFF